MQCPSCAAPLATHTRDCSGCGWPHARPQVTPPGGLSCTDEDEAPLQWAENLVVDYYHVLWTIVAQMFAPLVAWTPRMPRCGWTAMMSMQPR